MTKQEVLDFVADKLFEQGEPSMENGTCMYRTEDGLKCAAGWLIPDEQYSEFFEHQSIACLHILDKEIEGIVTQLQLVHDDSANAGDYFFSLDVGLADVADAYNLDYQRRINV